MYLLNSQASRLLPVPACPVTDTKRSRRSRPVAWSRSLSRRSSLVAAHERRLEALRATDAADLGHDAQRAPGRHRRRLALEQLLAGGLVRDGTQGRRARGLAHQHRAGRRDAWMRDAVLTRSPATMPWLTAPMVTAASPVSTPARAWAVVRAPGRAACGSTSTRSRAARTARSASSSCAVGAPQTAITASPMNFSTVPPYRPMTSGGEVEVAAKQLAHRLRVAVLGETP